MKPAIVGVSVWFALFATAPVFAQPSHPLAVEAGVVIGIVQPYASLGLVAGRWSFRASGGVARACNGQQLNVGRVIRDKDNAKHTIGIVWGRFNNGCWYGANNRLTRIGRYTGIAYDFQVRGFFLEFGPAFGARNPVGPGLGALSRVYGQVGYVYRFGHKYINDDE